MEHIALIMSLEHVNKQSGLAQPIEKFRSCKKKDTVDSLITTSGYIKSKENGFDSKMETFK